MNNTILTLFILACAALAVFAGEASAKDYNVLDYGAKGDNLTDCTAAIQKAIDECYDNRGGNVVFPTGEYVCRGSLEVKDGVMLKGTYVAPPTNDLSNKPDAAGNMKGSVIAAYAGKNDPDGTAFITLTGNNSGVQGLIIHYPEWSQKTVPPIPYSPCIAGYEGSNHSVINCNLLNPYVGILFRGPDRMTISGVYGYPIKTGIVIDQCYDICRIENCHFWPFNVTYTADDPYCKWINLNGTAFEFARTDWQYCSNCFCFGYGAGYRFTNRGSGACNGNFSGIGADSCTNSVLIEQIQPMGLAITNGEFVGRWNSADACPVDIRGGVTGKVSLMNCAFWGPINTCVRSDSDGARLSVIGCTFESWDALGTSAAAITLNKGIGIINGNTFAEKPTHIEIGAGAGAAVITANWSPNPLTVKNGIGDSCEISANIPKPRKLKDEDFKNYSLKLNGVNDESFVDGFIYSEPTNGGMRWSSSGANLELRGTPGADYTVTFNIMSDSNALMEGAGIYVDGKNLMPITQAGMLTLSNKVTMPSSGRIKFDVKVKNWSPNALNPAEPDKRILGVGIMEVRMISDPGAPVFNLNSMKNE